MIAHPSLKTTPSSADKVKVYDNSRALGNFFFKSHKTKNIGYLAIKNCEW